MTISPLERELILLKADFLEDSGDVQAAEALREAAMGPIIVVRPHDGPVYGPIDYARSDIGARVGESASPAQQSDGTVADGFVESIPEDVLLGRPGRQQGDTGPKFAVPGDEYRATA